MGGSLGREKRRSVYLGRIVLWAKLRNKMFFLIVYCLINLEVTIKIMKQSIYVLKYNKMTNKLGKSWLG